MFDRIVLNGTSYERLSDVPPRFQSRIRPFADLPLWEDPPAGLVLEISTVNVTPTTWPTLSAQLLPSVLPSATAFTANGGATSDERSRQGLASSLVNLYATHFNSTLSSEEVDALIGLAGDDPTQAAKTLARIHLPYVDGRHVDLSDVSESNRSEFFDDDIAEANRAGPSVAFDMSKPADLNPTLVHQGSYWRLEIPQSLFVRIRRDDPFHDAARLMNDERAVFSTEIRRMVRYDANEDRAASISGTVRGVYTGWTNDIPAPPSDRLDAFKTAAIGKNGLSEVLTSCGPGVLLLAIGTITIIGFLIVLIVFFLAVDLSTLFSF